MKREGLMLIKSRQDEETVTWSYFKQKIKKVSASYDRIPPDVSTNICSNKKTRCRIEFGFALK